MRELSLKGKTAFITGASSGIGRACAERFAEMGMNILMTARRVERLEALADDLKRKFKVDVNFFQLDVRKAQDVNRLVEDIQDKGIDIDILVNNAGLALSTDRMQEAKIENWDIMIDTNVKGLLYVTRALLPHMIEKNQGHIVNIGSVAGHWCYLSGNVYSATKHAVKAISESLRLDLYGTKIRVSEIDPGAVETEFSEVRWNDKERAKKLYEGFDPLVAEDIADAIAYCVTRPLHVNVSEMIIFPQAQAGVSAIYRGEPIKSIFDQDLRNTK